MNFGFILSVGVDGSGEVGCIVSVAAWGLCNQRVKWAASPRAGVGRKTSGSRERKARLFGLVSAAVGPPEDRQWLDACRYPIT